MTNNFDLFKQYIQKTYQTQVKNFKKEELNITKLKIN